MTQELIDLRTSIIEGRYDDALAIVDELEAMSKKEILRQIKSFLIRLLVQMIKNQVEQRLTNSWAASISNSLGEIQDLNLKDNKTSYYLNPDDWEPMLNPALEQAIRQASAEVMGGKLTPVKLGAMVDKPQLILTATTMILLTYQYLADALMPAVDEYLAQLPGGKQWREGE
jgi:hypothetical protein